jgi:hypothetical protein
MGKEILKCPNCGARVAIDVVLCPTCGTNVRTGETFDAKVKKVKPRVLHPEHFMKGVHLGVAIVFALVLFAGYMYQRQIEAALKLKPEEFRGYVSRLEMIDALGNKGAKQEARDVAEKLIKELKDKASQIKMEDAPTTAQLNDPKRVPRSIRAAEKALLGNLADKAEAKREKLL